MNISAKNENTLRDIQVVHITGHRKLNLESRIHYLVLKTWHPVFFDFFFMVFLTFKLSL